MRQFSETVDMMAAITTGEEKARSLGVKVTGSQANGLKVELSREMALEEIFGTDQPDQALALFSQCMKVLKRDESSDEHPGHDERQFLLSIIRDLAPCDAVERMLAVQMAATHVATIRSARWMATADNLPQLEAHYTGYNKLARTFAAQVEALRKHRTGGQQKVIVEHVTVNAGGQAIVGSVQHRGEGGR